MIKFKISTIQNKSQISSPYYFSQEDHSLKSIKANLVYNFAKNPDWFVVGGFSDNSFKLFNSQKNKIEITTFHKRVITCLGLKLKFFNNFK